MVTKSTGKKEKVSKVARGEATLIVPEIKNQVPSEEEIRNLAEILYQNRIDSGEPGSAEDDWLKAESYLQFPDNYTI